MNNSIQHTQVMWLTYIYTYINMYIYILYIIHTCPRQEHTMADQHQQASNSSHLEAHPQHGNKITSENSKNKTYIYHIFKHTLMYTCIYPHHFYKLYYRILPNTRVGAKT